MKNLKEMKIAREAILTEKELTDIGGIYVGNNTSYSGPSNPSYVETYVDGDDWGQDGTIDGGWGDSWNLTDKSLPPSSDKGTLFIKA